jgi:hypothetical protein
MRAEPWRTFPTPPHMTRLAKLRNHIDSDQEGLRGNRNRQWDSGSNESVLAVSAVDSAHGRTALSLVGRNANQGQQVTRPSFNVERIDAIDQIAGVLHWIRTLPNRRYK